MDKKKIINYSVLLISFISFLVLTFFVNKLGIFPDKYVYLFYLVEIIIYITCIILSRFKKLACFIIGLILSIVFLIINLFGMYYVRHFDKFIDKGFTGDVITTFTFYLVTSKKNEVSDINEVTLDNEITYFSISKNNSIAREKLGNYEYHETDNINTFLLENKSNNFYLLVDKINYKTTFEFDNKLSEEDYKIIYEFDIETSEKRNTVVKDSYTILVMGKDFSEERNDLNMLITVNNITRKVLITSIPRDYYIPTVGYKYNDSLMVMGILGDDVVIKSLEAYFGIEIDFKISVYTQNLVGIVDEINGIEFCSDRSYTTTHAMVWGTYDDSLGKKLRVKKGCQHLNGIQTLTVARERLAFKGENGGDRVRQVNCRKILISIIEKMLKTTTLTNYTEVLDLFSDFYKTDMNRDTVTTLIKNVIKYGDYEILEQSVNGKGGYGPLRQNTCVSDLLIPDVSTVKAASDKINQIVKEK
jgi:LCP family protein required for cell wall assembly